MENKFMLSNVVLYAKGWYLNTGDIVNDLKKILKLDGYEPYTDMDVYSIILNSVQNSKLCRLTELKEVLNGIHPQNCWQYGYYVKDNYFWSNKPIDELPVYDMPTALLYYTISNLRFMERKYWNVCTPKLTKYPKGEDITVRKVFEMFVLNKLNK